MRAVYEYLSNDNLLCELYNYDEPTNFMNRSYHLRLILILTSVYPGEYYLFRSVMIVLLSSIIIIIQLQDN